MKASGALNCIFFTLMLGKLTYEAANIFLCFWVEHLASEVIGLG